MAENKRKPAPVVEEAEELEEEEQAPKVERKPKKKAKTPMIFVRFMDVFGVFKRNEIAKAMPFVLFVTFLIICYSHRRRYLHQNRKRNNQLPPRNGSKKRYNVENKHIIHRDVFNGIGDFGSDLPYSVCSGILLDLAGRQFFDTL